MSYLVTEIAMEMLGYRFYDINGDEQPVNLERDKKETSTNSETLEEYLGLKWDDGTEEFEEVSNRNAPEVEIMESEDDLLASRTIHPLVLRSELAVMRKQMIDKHNINGCDGVIDSATFKNYLMLDKQLLKSELERLKQFHEIVTQTCKRVDYETKKFS